MSAQQVTDASDRERDEPSKSESPLCVQLTQDTMFVMAGLGFLDLGLDPDTFRANDVNEHIVNMPSVIHGMLHFTTEPLFAAPFLMRQLKATRFAYPFKTMETPTQYGYPMI